MPVIQLFVTFFLMTQCFLQPVFNEKEWFENIQKADSSSLYSSNKDSDGKFFNPWLKNPGLHVNGAWHLYQLFTLGQKYDIFPEKEYSHLENDYAYLYDDNFNSISFAGHASVIIKMDKQIIFTDPFFSNKALAAKKTVQIDFDFSKVPKGAAVLISHNHYDHLDEYSVTELAKKDASFIVPLGLKDFFLNLGIKEVYELDWWESVNLEGINYTLLPSQHVSRRMGSASRETLWGSYLIEGSKTVYFSGDTGYFHGFKEYGRLYDIDYALLGAGASEPRWFMHLTHLNASDFFNAAEDLGAKIAIPIHYGIIKMTDEPILYPLYEIIKILEMHPEYSKQVKPLRVGEYLEME